MRKQAVLVVGLVLLGLVLSGCAGRSMPDDRLYVNLLWHHHQPLYYKDPVSGLYSRPWVRMHAMQSYYDMAAILRDHPEVRVTFNLTPVLLRQLDDYANGAKDIYWALAEKHPTELNESERQFVLERFFDANHENVIGRFPRYTELLERKQAIDTRTAAGRDAFSVQDYLDLQVLFNLAWFDPSFLDQEPLAALVAKGRDFAQEDKLVIFDEALRIIRGVVEVYRELQDAGQIEVITTPYAHPILPLIFSTQLAAEGDPTAELPAEFYYPNDAVAHLERSVEVYRESFDRDPRGLWPAEGAVAQEIVKMVGDAGFQWMASGEQVLAPSLGLDGFFRDSNDTVTNADALYRPYIVRPARGEPVTMVFRDLRLSDLIGFEYSGTPGRLATTDLLERLERIRLRLIEETGEDGGPHLVSIILDGENPWENYRDGGREFLNSFYALIAESETLQTTTVPEFMEAFPDQRQISDLWPGSWASPDYSVWIGEREETRAWELLGEVRSFLALYDMRNRRQTTPEQLEAALDYMYLAEGSDWFWWYGTDKDSGNDQYFDRAYRELLANVFRALAEPVPDSVTIPIIPERAEPPARAPTGLFSPVVDGRIDQEEWAPGGFYRTSGDVQARSSATLEALRYGFDAERLHLSVQTSVPVSQALNGADLHLYLSHPGQVASHPFVDREGERSELIGFDASMYVRVSRGGATLVRRTLESGWQEQELDALVALGNRSVELSLPLTSFGDVESGDEFSLALFSVAPGAILDRLPSSGPGRTNVPELGGGTLVLDVIDPVGDDHGPGGYIYPGDVVFTPGSFDLTRFVVEEEERFYKFTVELGAGIRNPWGSGINLSIQTIDIYVDEDPGAGTGARRLLAGRNAAMPSGYGWEYALWVEGWNQELFAPADPGDPESPAAQTSGAPLRVRVNPEAGVIIIRVPREAMPIAVPLEELGYTVVVLSQEGFPAPGVLRVRDIERSAAQWVAGGGPDDINHTRIFDMAVPEGAIVTQEELLGSYRSIGSGSANSLTADDLPIAHVLEVE